MRQEGSINRSRFRSPNSPPRTWRSRPCRNNWMCSASMNSHIHKCTLFSSYPLINTYALCCFSSVVNRKFQDVSQRYQNLQSSHSTSTESELKMKVFVFQSYSSISMMCGTLRDVRNTGIKYQVSEKKRKIEKRMLNLYFTSRNSLICALLPLMCAVHLQELERRLALQEQDSVIVKNMKSEVARLPELEREIKRLREENTFLRCQHCHQQTFYVMDAYINLYL